MKVEKHFVIDGQVVNHVLTKGNVAIYERDSQAGYAELCYVVVNGEVIARIESEGGAEGSSSLDIEEVK